jgi:hypothetical protein
MGQEPDGVPSLAHHRPLTLGSPEDRLDDLDIRGGDAPIALVFDKR